MHFSPPPPHTHTQSKVDVHSSAKFVAINLFLLLHLLFGSCACSLFCNHLNGEENTGCFTYMYFIWLVTVIIMWLIVTGQCVFSAVSDCGIS